MKFYEIKFLFSCNSPYSSLKPSNFVPSNFDYIGDDSFNEHLGIDAYVYDNVVDGWMVHESVIDMPISSKEAKPKGVVTSNYKCCKLRDWC